jgi:hypothetical protein|tara:strand:+ start:539 stop:787 length:249 start_codon:yes stop_codon:yes gene_type:complete
MSNKKIIYKKKNGVVSIITPAPDALKSMTIEEIAKKDVPTNYKYKIVDVSEISSDRTFRDAWVIDDSELTDGTGENYGILEE